MVRYFVFSLLILWKLVLASKVQPPPNSECVYKSNIACGVPIIQDETVSKTSAEALTGEFPWHVAIYHRDSGKPVYRCGGSLISERFVLTAAHCAVNERNDFPLSAEVFELLLGYHDLFETENPNCRERVGVRRNHVHPDYRTHSYRHDLALLELERQVRFTDHILPVCLDTDDEDPLIFHQMKGKIPGWGYNGLSPSSSKLHITEIPIVIDAQCLLNDPGLFAKSIYPGMFCGGLANGSNVCDGDSGGGLVTLRQGRWELVGVLSYTALRGGKDYFCTTSQYSAYMKLRHYQEWIASVHYKSAVNNHSKKIICGKRMFPVQSINVKENSQASEWPWHAAVYALSRRSREYVCDGTLISANHIMTAGACVRDWHQWQRPFIVQLGQNQYLLRDTSARDVRVTAVETSDDSQMALLRLAEDVQFNNYIQPICLPFPTETSRKEVHKRSGFIVGYDQRNPRGDVSQMLQSANIPIVDSHLCMAKDMLCAGYGKATGTCLGDQGGGFFERDESDTWSITGVIDQIRIHCEHTCYVRMIDTMQHLSWIKDRLKQPLLRVLY